MMYKRRERVYGVVAVCALPVLVSLVILAGRLAAVLGPFASLTATSGGESVSIYNIIKLRHGLCLYADPCDPPYYATTLYNAGFYEAYAAVLRLFPGDNALAVVVLRLVTLALACTGTAAVLAYALVVLGRRGRPATPRLIAVAMVLLAVCTTLGTMPGWWVLTVRPDVGVAAFAALALATVFTLGFEREWAAGLLGGLFLAAAWSFKQSSVFLLAGLVTSALWERRYRFAVAILLPVVATAALLLVCFGAEYRYNTFFAPSLSPFDVRNLLSVASRVLVKGAFPLAAAVASLGVLSHLNWLRPDEVRTLKVCWWVTLAAALVTCCRKGSEVNYYFEFWMVVAFLAVIQGRVAIESALLRPPTRVAWGILLAAVAFGSVGLDGFRLLRPRLLGTTVRLDAASMKGAELERARQFAATQTKPVLCEPALWGLAWDPPLPTYVFDDYPYFHQVACPRGLLRDGGPEGLLARHYFGVVILERDDESLGKLALSAGYLRRPEWTQLAVLVSP